MQIQRDKTRNSQTSKLSLFPKVLVRVAEKQAWQYVNENPASY
jgi:hypothetical protein